LSEAHPADGVRVVVVVVFMAKVADPGISIAAQRGLNTQGLW